MRSIYCILFFTVFFILCKESLQAENVLNCKCGRRNDHGFRIVGGKVAEPHSYPWIAALKHKLYRIVFCGGALINDRYVVTAGHCLDTYFRYFNVILGMHNQRDKNVLVMDVKKILLHEGYESKGGYDINDIALIKLDGVVKFTPEIKPICLPYAGSDYTGEIAQVAGWGTTKFKSQTSSSLLKETDLIVIPQEQCKKHKLIGPLINSRMLCAYQDETDTCQGDSGGPLTYETQSGKNELIGVVSWGLDCGRPDTPGIYTKVTSFLDWIDKNTEDGMYCQY